MLYYLAQAYSSTENGKTPTLEIDIAYKPCLTLHTVKCQDFEQLFY